MRLVVNFLLFTMGLLHWTDGWSARFFEYLKHQQYVIYRHGYLSRGPEGAEECCHIHDANFNDVCISNNFKTSQSQSDTQISKICKVSISLWCPEWPNLSCLWGEQWLIIWSKVIFKSCWLNELKRNPTPNWTDFSRFGGLYIYIHNITHILYTCILCMSLP